MTVAMLIASMTTPKRVTPDPRVLNTSLTVAESIRHSIQFGVMKDVIAERESQDIKWGMTCHSHAHWHTILNKQVGEAAREVNNLTFEDNEHYLDKLDKELVQVAAVAIATLVDLRHRYGYLYVEKRESNESES